MRLAVAVGRRVEPLADQGVLGQREVVGGPDKMNGQQVARDLDKPALSAFALTPLLVGLRACVLAIRIAFLRLRGFCSPDRLPLTMDRTRRRRTPVRMTLLVLLH